MDKVLFSAIIGLVAGVIDIIPMIMQKLPPLLHRFGVFPLLFRFNYYSQCRHTSYSLVAGRRRCRLGTNYPDAYSGRTFG